MLTIPETLTFGLGGEGAGVQLLCHNEKIVRGTSFVCFKFILGVTNNIIILKKMICPEGTFSC